MSEPMTTPTNEIVESFKAIQVAAVERYAALDREMRELEMAFPSLRHQPTEGVRIRVGKGNRAPRTPEQRARYSERSKAMWARRRAAQNVAQPEPAYATA
jgi:hypothetical protein